MSTSPTALVARGTSSPRETVLRATRRHRSSAAVVPFFAYVGIFLVLPALIVVVGAFIDPDGSFGAANFVVLTQANTLDAFLTSLVVSVSSALLGTVIGGLAAAALVVGAPRNQLLRRVVVSLSSVLAQFGGVMLAFAFIATIGQTGIVTVLLQRFTGIELDPTWLSSLPGLVLVYCYFQVPLMIIVFVPALDGLQPQWREATEVLGGNAWTYWSSVAGPILLRPLIASFLLLFANAFSSFATAAALFAQRSILVPLLIQSSLRNELDTTLGGQAAMLAASMIVVVALAMAANHRLGARSAKWQH